MGLVSEIAAVEFSLSSAGWNELSQFLVQCTQSAHVAHRQIGLALFGRLIETASGHMTQGNNMQSLVQMFGAAMQDSEFSVRLAALRFAYHVFQVDFGHRNDCAKLMKLCWCSLGRCFDVCCMTQSC